MNWSPRTHPRKRFTIPTCPRSPCVVRQGQPLYKGPGIGLSSSKLYCTTIQCVGDCFYVGLGRTNNTTDFEIVLGAHSNGRPKPTLQLCGDGKCADSANYPSLILSRDVCLGLEPPRPPTENMREDWRTGFYTKKIPM